MVSIKPRVLAPFETLLLPLGIPEVAGKCLRVFVADGTGSRAAAVVCMIKLR